MIEKLAGSEVSQLIVVDQAEKPVGVISTDDLLHYLVSIHRQVVQPVHPVLPNQTGTVRRGSLAASRLRQRREDSIGEEVEEESESSPENVNLTSSCSPPHWFNV